MITLGLIKSEMRSFLVNQTIASRLPDWIYWVCTDILSTPYNFWWNRKTDTFSTVANQAEYFLSYRCNPNQLVQMIDTSVNNSTVNRCFIEDIYNLLSFSTDTGDPINWAVEGNYGVQYQTTTGVEGDDAIRVNSDSASDLGIKVIIHGKSSGIDTIEELELNGTTPVAGAIVWDVGSIWQVSLGSTTTGNVEIYGTSWTYTIAKIPAGQLRIQCPKIRLWRIPADVRSLQYSYQKRPIKVTNENDMVDLPDDAFECLLLGIQYWGNKNNGDIDYAINTIKPMYENEKQKLISKAQAYTVDKMDFASNQDDTLYFSLPQTVTYTMAP